MQDWGHSSSLNVSVALVFISRPQGGKRKQIQSNLNVDQHKERIAITLLTWYLLSGVVQSTFQSQWTWEPPETKTEDIFSLFGGHKLLLLLKVDCFKCLLKIRIIWHRSCNKLFLEMPSAGYALGILLLISILLSILVMFFLCHSCPQK